MILFTNKVISEEHYVLNESLLKVNLLFASTRQNNSFMNKL